MTAPSRDGATAAPVAGADSWTGESELHSPNVSGKPSVDCGPAGARAEFLAEVKASTPLSVSPGMRILPSVLLAASLWSSQEPDCPDFESDGLKLRVSKGNAYRWEGGRWVLLQRLYDPDFYAKNYVEKEGKVYLRSDGKLWEMKRSFKSGFEDSESLRDLVGDKTGWTAFALLSPRAPTVKDDVALRHKILKGESGFLDNRLELDERIVHSGKRSLKCTSVAASKEMVCAKSSLQSEFIHFKKGDDLWYSGWYYVKEGMPQTLVDFESTWIDGQPGLRIFVDEGGCAYVELKWADKPKYVQPRDRRVKIPRKHWVRFQAHFKLSEAADGVIEVWQDGVKIVEARGRTLPLANTILNSLEVGISANGHGHGTTMYVDDVSVSDRPLAD